MGPNKTFTVVLIFPIIFALVLLGISTFYKHYIFIPNESFINNALPYADRQAMTLIMTDYDNLDNMAHAKAPIPDIRFGYDEIIIEPEENGGPYGKHRFATIKMYKGDSDEPLITTTLPIFSIPSATNPESMKHTYVKGQYENK